MFGARFDLRKADVKRCFVIRLSENAMPCVPADKPARRPFSDPAGIPIAFKIAGGLRGEGYKVREPKQGKGCEAFFACYLRTFRVNVVVGIERTPPALLCDITTWPSWPFWRRTLPSDINEWRALCSIMHQVISKQLTPDMLLWLTHEEADEFWEKQRTS